MSCRHYVVFSGKFVVLKFSQNLFSSFPPLVDFRPFPIKTIICCQRFHEFWNRLKFVEVFKALNVSSLVKCEKCYPQMSVKKVFVRM